MTLKKKHGNMGNKNAATCEELTDRFTGKCLLDEKETWVETAKDNNLNLQNFMRNASNEYALKLKKEPLK